MADENSFLSRWSRRKVQARQAEGLPETPEPTPLADAQTPTTTASPRTQEPPRTDDEPDKTPAPQPPPPTLADVTELTHDSDFTRFVKSDVSGEVRNAALKKLFTDPHFNVMDGLDTYIEDFNQTTPLPLSMIRQMAQSAFLGLVEQKPPEQSRQESAQEPAQAPPEAIEHAANKASADAPHAAAPEAAPTAADMKPHDENPDLRLQSIDTPGSSGLEPGT